MWEILKKNNIFSSMLCKLGGNNTTGHRVSRFDTEDNHREYNN